MFGDKSVNIESQGILHLLISLSLRVDPFFFTFLRISYLTYFLSLNSSD
uniref:Uncharacterized protein n=1 Tax=Heterorhabditis bacteriophora TaxID=37862 RepID=A0A1I7WT35_HETBA